MQLYNQSREKNVQQRLHPDKDHPRYYLLSQLTKGLTEIVEKYVGDRPHRRLYDFGCGVMPYKAIFQPHVERYVGVDLPGNELADILIDSEGKAEATDRSASIVLSNQVLEHVASPSTYLNECYRLLEDDGLLVCSTHGYWKYHPDPSDYWRWTGEGLRKIIEEAGFQIIDTIGICNLASLSVILFQDAIYYKFKNKRYRPLVIWCLQRLTAWLDKKVSGDRKNEAAVFLIVAIKPKTV